MPLVGVQLEGKLHKPMQFFVKYFVDSHGKSTQKIYLQQIITRFVGGKYNPTPGYTYLAVNTTKAAGIQRLLTNLDRLPDEIENLIKEANRFMYMYCHLDKI